MPWIFHQPSGLAQLLDNITTVIILEWIKKIYVWYRTFVNQILYALSLLIWFSWLRKWNIHLKRAGNSKYCLCIHTFNGQREEDNVTVGGENRKREGKGAKFCIGESIIENHAALQHVHLIYVLGKIWLTDFPTLINAKLMSLYSNYSTFWDIHMNNPISEVTFFNTLNPILIYLQHNGKRISIK